eukprot:CAMPEP_0116880144 /NCGR_PEP_ID=MMETSP0463-20121206/12032_1 /TAXON_ID=181622 /ORGANISM="Strombidinopsis sp, Strain SopsisLIS2011" /LENGTH=180 /DNA_ID=CAMNT_0004530347 /DNA_START=272 /DNA_END=813 /DNA_ORIENTATION=+
MALFLWGQQSRKCNLSMTQDLIGSLLSRAPVLIVKERIMIQLHQRQQAQEAPQLRQELYGAATFTGSAYTDDVCIQDETSAYLCVSSFEYFLVTSQEGLYDPIDGIMGLSRNIASDGITVGPLFVEAQVTATNFVDPLFAFKMDNVNGTSWIDFGQIRTASVKDVNAITYLNLQSHFFWL